MNKSCYNDYAWCHSNMSNKSTTIYQNMHVNDSVKKKKQTIVINICNKQFCINISN